MLSEAEHTMILLERREARGRYIEQTDGDNGLVL